MLFVFIGHTYLMTGRCNLHILAGKQVHPLFIEKISVMLILLSFQLERKNKSFK